MVLFTKIFVMALEMMIIFMRDGRGDGNDYRDGNQDGASLKCNRCFSEIGTAP